MAGSVFVALADEKPGTCGASRQIDCIMVAKLQKYAKRIAVVQHAEQVALRQATWLIRGSRPAVLDLGPMTNAIGARHKPGCSAAHHHWQRCRCDWQEWRGPPSVPQHAWQRPFRPPPTSALSRTLANSVVLRRVVPSTDARENQSVSALSKNSGGLEPINASTLWMS